MLNLKRKQPTTRLHLQNKISKKEVNNKVELFGSNEVETISTRNVTAVKTSSRNNYLLSQVKICRFKKKLENLKLKQKVFKKFDTEKDSSIEHIINLSKKCLTNTQLQFFESRLRMNNCVKKGKRWTVKDKLLALRIMYHSS